MCEAVTGGTIGVMSTQTLPGRSTAGDGHATGDRERPNPRHRVCATGRLRIDGQVVTSARAVELLHLLQHEGPVLPKKVVESRLYGGYCSRSSLWYPLKTCREAGIAVYYDTSRRSVVLEDPLLFDLDIALDHLAAGDLRSALWILGGWPGRTGGGSYSTELKKQLADAVIDSPAGLCWAEIDDVFRTLDQGR